MTGRLEKFNQSNLTVSHSLLPTLRKRSSTTHARSLRSNMPSSAERGCARNYHLFLDVTPCRLPDAYRRSGEKPPSVFHPHSIPKKESARYSETSANICEHYTVTHPRRSQPFIIFMHFSSVPCVLHSSFFFFTVAEVIFFANEPCAPSTGVDACHVRVKNIPNLYSRGRRQIKYILVHSRVNSTHMIDTYVVLIRYMSDALNSTPPLRSVLRFFLPFQFPYRDKTPIHSRVGEKVSVLD